jgi:hypothetical protein
VPQCITFVPQCVTFVPQCVTFVPQCITFVPQCITFVPQCVIRMFRGSTHAQIARIALGSTIFSQTYASHTDMHVGTCACGQFLPKCAGHTAHRTALAASLNMCVLCALCPVCTKHTGHTFEGFAHQVTSFVRLQETVESSGSPFSAAKARLVSHVATPATSYDHT